MDGQTTIPTKQFGKNPDDKKQLTKNNFPGKKIGKQILVARSSSHHLQRQTISAWSSPSFL